MGFEWHDRRGPEGTGFVRTLNDLLPAYLPSLLPKLHRSVQDSLGQMVDQPVPESGLV